ncbi:hypothetical protein CALCODRAFT_64100 [Calocera cornea HHB12733]|uniref:F-box domain-containing protein n=1 Tax=Calocera cornea HHB12733 TaxID=1353952 RepID=A0A165DLS0_9BASI|nr:hypothetical protein CALCODRAFT_64100 [Calocera cornea HHB12733]
MPRRTAQKGAPPVARELDINFGERWHSKSPARELDLIDTISKTKLDIQRLTTFLKQSEDALFSERSRRAPISRIPDDILTMIFEVKVDELRPSQTATRRLEQHSPPRQLVCSQVSRRWRQVAFRTSSLWSCFVIHNTRSLEFALSILSKLTCRFGLALGLKCSVTKTAGPLLQRIASTVSRYRNRMVRLRFEMCDHAILNFALILKLPMPSLTELECNRSHYCNFYDRAAPRWQGQGLQHATGLLQINFLVCNLPTDFPLMPSISRISFQDVTCASAKHLCFFLTRVPNLQQLRFERISASYGNTFQSDVDYSRVDPPTLAKLHLLKLSGDPALFLTSFSHVTFPRLQHLVLSQIPVPGPDMTSFLEKQNAVHSLALLLPWRHTYDRPWSHKSMCGVLDHLALPSPHGGPKCSALSEITIVDTWIDNRATKHPTLNSELSSSVVSFVENRQRLQSPISRIIVCPPLDDHVHDSLKDKVTLICRADLRPA